MQVLSLALLSGLRISVGRRCSLGLALLWLWQRAAAAAPIWPLAWELQYVAGAALKRKKKKKILESSKKQNLDLWHTNYLHSLYIVLGIINNLEMI